MFCCQEYNRVNNECHEEGYLLGALLDCRVRATQLALAYSVAFIWIFVATIIVEVLMLFLFLFLILKS